jgi:ADP-heptose:LPS heptosyltransferase
MQPGTLSVTMRKLILKSGFSPGDIVMLTAAVRDLHHWYPGQFLTDVRTLCPGLWENNPHLTPLPEDGSGVELIDCSYPLIDRCNEAPYHCLHGFIDFLSQRLGLAIRPTAFNGDIHLSDLERSWYSQVQEVTGADTPFWIVAAGGKYDVTIKWWQTERYQKVVDHFRGRIVFAQVGEFGHHHPRLEGVIDLRGQTNLRELVRLVYHSQGVLCSVTALMHLAAAVETKGSTPRDRPCVVVAGGREPVHWEAYPGHQFIHTNGALPCCATGGCWKDRVVPLRDGDKRDRPDHLCVDVVDQLPRCMDMISPEEIIRRVELYYSGGMLKHLSARQRRSAERGIVATRSNPYDRQPLTLHNAGTMCEQYVRTIPEYPDRFRGRGIVICGGGARYFTNAWVCINMLRWLGCRLPIQVWYLGPRELDGRMKQLLAPLGVKCVNAFGVRGKHPARTLGGWELKPYAILHCSFEEVLLLDADNVPVVNPEYLFQTLRYQATGAVFWPDYGREPRAQPVWRSCLLRRPKEREFESGQILMDKRRCWKALRLCMWFNENSDFYYRYLHGDKETFHLAFRKLKKSYALVKKPIFSLRGTMCQHDFEGNRIFQHRNTDKWNLFLTNKRVPGFRYEAQCRQFVKQLQQIWDGGISSVKKPDRKSSAVLRRAPILQAVMISCPERTDVLRKTLKNLARTDWGTASVHVQMDAETGEDHQDRQMKTALRALQWSLDASADYVLFLEDDLAFNRHLRHNLERWKPLRNGDFALAGLYNPNLRESAYDLQNEAVVVAPDSVFGSQAFVISKAAVSHVVRRWNQVEGMQDIKISRLAGRLKYPVLYHCPSLIQHVGKSSVWGGVFHQARDFDAFWKA